MRAHVVLTHPESKSYNAHLAATARQTLEKAGWTVTLCLWPVNFSLAYGGFSVRRPFIAHGVEAGLRYSDASVVEARLRQIEEDLRDTLRRLDERATVPFNRMADWGRDGRIAPDAPAFSPFIRHRKDLTL